MFCEYAEEIANPENKARYEMEIKQLEADRGVDCEFIHPHPGSVELGNVTGVKGKKDVDGIWFWEIEG